MTEIVFSGLITTRGGCKPFFILDFSRVGTTQTQAGGDGRQLASSVKPEAPVFKRG